MSTPHRTLNLRLDEEAYSLLRALSSARGVSMNKVVEDSILAAAEADRKLRVKQAFARIASTSADDQSVEFAFDAQREVVIGEE